MPVAFFGDRIADLLRSLKRLHQSQEDTVLLAFFMKQASSVLREEIGAQPRELRYRLPSFTGIVGLAEHHFSFDVQDRAIENALTFVCHMASLIG